MSNLSNLKKYAGHPVLLGTALLTATGLASRIIGFFYRIFLSHTIGAQGVGIYQLIFPVFALGIAFCGAGIQTAVSKYTAEAAGAGRCPQTYLYAGLMLSVSLSVLFTLLIYTGSDAIATVILDEPRCAALLRIVSLSLPLAAIHSCINGYYYGLQKTGVPSVSQLLEQICRVLCVYLIYRICESQGRTVTAAMAVWGIVLGELAGALFSLTVVRFVKCTERLSACLHQIVIFSIPLTTNRVLINLINSTEAILIPICLKAYGYSNEDALSIFGILTGMAMPMILFPSVLTNSVSVMLLPSISQAKAQKNQTLIHRTIRRTIESCLVLGFASTLFFLLTYSYIGQYLFANSLAGVYVRTLSFICPFMFLSTTLNSILHGLGHPTATLMLNLSSCLLRIAVIWFFVPVYGIRAYLYGMLASQMLSALCAILLLNRSKDL
ncbi:Stage V sporulation protein B [Eubacterium plexicaudatum ASF492]|uniref:Stage V sporulation protein B n=1 Tax=Eubacterium plexicaudatum ASF492 TaxID=1235802 RepID=N2AN70_9FIRM|nr:Stage V sporulation protein B [Eubacterium plexicaudatum ASF492]